MSCSPGEQEKLYSFNRLLQGNYNNGTSSTCISMYTLYLVVMVETQWQNFVYYLKSYICGMIALMW